MVLEIKVFNVYGIGDLKFIIQYTIIMFMCKMLFDKKCIKYCLLTSLVSHVYQGHAFLWYVESRRFTSVYINVTQLHKCAIRSLRLNIICFICCTMDHIQLPYVHNAVNINVLLLHLT